MLSSQSLAWTQQAREMFFYWKLASITGSTEAVRLVLFFEPWSLLIIAAGRPLIMVALVGGFRDWKYSIRVASLVREPINKGWSTECLLNVSHRDSRSYNKRIKNTSIALYSLLVVFNGFRNYSLSC